jgi:hypothetical protein
VQEPQKSNEVEEALKSASSTDGVNPGTKSKAHTTPNETQTLNVVLAR